jgi:hypothetical protein
MVLVCVTVVALTVVSVADVIVVEMATQASHSTGHDFLMGPLNRKSGLLHRAPTSLHEGGSSTPLQLGNVVVDVAEVVVAVTVDVVDAVLDVAVVAVVDRQC